MRNEPLHLEYHDASSESKVFVTEKLVLTRTGTFQNKQQIHEKAFCTLRDSVTKACGTTSFQKKSTKNSFKFDVAN